MKKYRVINLPCYLPSKEQEKLINEQALRGYRLISVSDENAYFESLKTWRTDKDGFMEFVE